jgi:hypothetical protein
MQSGCGFHSQDAIMSAGSFKATGKSSREFAVFSSVITPWTLVLLELPPSRPSTLQLTEASSVLSSGAKLYVMADPLSIAAAGAGFLSLAGQILDGIIKLRGFIATVDSAPREIHDLCHELDIFRGLLEEAGRRVQESLPMGVDTNHLKDAFAHCEKMRGHAESMLKRLEVNLSRSKATTALKYPFKRKEIEGMLLGMERGKTSLLLANQSFESYVSPSHSVASYLNMVSDGCRSLASRRHVVLSEEHDLLLNQQRKISEEIAQVVSTA